MGLNKVLITGTVVSVENKSFAQGGKVAVIVLKVDDKKWDSTIRAMVDVAYDLPFEAFNSKINPLADKASGLKPGDFIMIDGKVRLDQWKDQRNGEARSRLKMGVENFEVVGKSMQVGSDAIPGDDLGDRF